MHSGSRHRLTGEIRPFSLVEPPFFVTCGMIDLNNILGQVLPVVREASSLMVREGFSVEEKGSAENGLPVLGVVYSPWRGELWHAVRGGGAFCNGNPVHVSRRPFEDGILFTAMSTYRKEFAGICRDIIYDIYGLQRFPEDRIGRRGTLPDGFRKSRTLF